MKPRIRDEIEHLNSGSQDAQLPVFHFTTEASAAQIRIGYGIPTDGTGPCVGRKGIVCVTRDASTEPHDALVLFAKDTLDGSPYPWQKWCEYRNAAQADWRARCFEVHHITLRAMGLVYGLHKWDLDQFGRFGPSVRITVMSAWARRRGTAGFDRPDFGTCDIARLQLLYDVHDASSRYSTCLDRQPTSLELAASTTSIPFQGQVDFLAKLQISQLDQNLFKGNDLSGRHVQLQRSVDAWHTFDSIDMVAGDHGTYTLTLHPDATARYRAIYRTPGDEGLFGDLSSPVQVNVGPPPPPPTNG